MDLESHHKSSMQAYHQLKNSRHIFPFLWKVFYRASTSICKIKLNKYVPEIPWASLKLKFKLDLLIFIQSTIQSGKENLEEFILFIWFSVSGIRNIICWIIEDAQSCQIIEN